MDKSGRLRGKAGIVRNLVEVHVPVGHQLERALGRLGADPAESDIRPARFSWPERELVRQLGERLYGKRPDREANGA